MLSLQQHIDEMLEFEYSNCVSSTLWKDLEIRFNNQREVLLPSARDEWTNLSRPTGSLALPEANVIDNDDNKNSGSKRGRCNPHGSGRGRGHYDDNLIRVRLDNAGEFTSHDFNDYCMSVGIVVEHSVAHVHTQNGLAESLIKRLQLIARPLIMRTKLPMSMWGHAILHAASLIRIRPSANHKYSPIQLASGQEPNISHLRIFGCVVYIEPLTSDLLTTRFTDCHFDEAVFPELGDNHETVYVDDLNIIGTNKEINEVVMHLKEEFEMKDLGRSLNVDNNPFRPCEEDEDVLGPEVLYLSAIEALMYLTNYAGYLFDPHKARSQTGYMFLNGGTAISWRTQKQILVATSSNHAEVIALH
ncbi:retrovirus-related pol polyprotein from transposon TNT 1-94 [Tanacetum coccineum]